MKPLVYVAWGLLVIVADLSVNGFDLVADPAGWVLILVGVGNLPARAPWRGQLTLIAGLGTAVSVALWFPGVDSALELPSGWLAWCDGLPQWIFTVLLCLSLARLARAAGDLKAEAWLHGGALATVVTSALVLVVVVVVNPATIVALVVLGLAAFVFVVVLLFVYAGRGWAAPDATVPVGAPRA